METRQIFFCMFVMAKKLKELLTSTWDGITASVICVSSTQVVLNAKLPDLLWITQTKEGDKKRINPKTVTLSPPPPPPPETKHKQLTPIAVMTMHAITSLLYVLINKIKNTSLLAKMHPFTCCLTVNHQTVAKLGLQTFEKNQWTFLWQRKGINFSSRNNFTNWDLLAKVSVSVETIIL